MRNQASRWAALALGLTLCPALGQAQQQQLHQHSHTGQPPAVATLGEVHFAVSCTPGAQAAFDDAMKLQHSFWFQASRQAFQRVLEHDPNCVMAYWGQAMSTLDNAFLPTPARNVAEGRALLERARQLGPKTEREAAYIDALAILFSGDDVAGRQGRLERHEQAMARLHERFPGDPEAAIYHALSLGMAALPTDRTYARQLRAGEILEREFARRPNHPGVAHYLIHTYDVPALARRGLPAAEHYVRIAPDAHHALHMPSHIFTRVGRWEASIETNRRSADNARGHGQTTEELHALDYMVYAYLQTGRDGEARRVVEGLGQYGLMDRPVFIGPFALAAMPARLAMERGAWAEAAALQPRQTGFLHVDAITRFARAVGLARSGRPDEAGPEVEALRTTAAALRERGDAYWAEQVDIQRRAAEGWVAYARGRREEGLAALHEAAEREGRTQKHIVTPGPLAPAREQLAEMLLETGRPAEALREFGAVAQTEPNRFRAVAGAARAAERAGDGEAVRRHYAHLLEVAAGAEEGARAEVAAARAYIAKQ
jgi:tetratricopeptide (TPR) repeat protein